ncbi:SCO family protein, partial [Kaarinaea lacus]
MKNNKKLILASLVVVIFAVVATYHYLARPDLDIPGVRYFSQPVSLKPFLLRDQFANEFGIDQLKDRWSILFFGYTHCPDICPTAMHDMANIYNKLEENGVANINVIFVSVDPLRDKPTELKSFLEYFSPLFLGVTGNKTELDKLAERVGAIYEFEDSKTGIPIRDT